MTKKYDSPSRTSIDTDEDNGNSLHRVASRTQINRFMFWFERLKKSIYCNLTDKQLMDKRFAIILERMEEEFPHYTALKRGKACKDTKLYICLWKKFKVFVNKWQETSPKKFTRS